MGALAPVAVPEGAATLVRVHVTPGAKRSELRGYDVWRQALSVAVAAPAREGKANGELCRLMAEALEVPQAAVAVVEGRKARLKRVRVEGLGVEAVEGRIGAVLEG